MKRTMLFSAAMLCVLTACDQTQELGKNGSGADSDAGGGAGQGTAGTGGAAGQGTAGTGGKGGAAGQGAAGSGGSAGQGAAGTGGAAGKGGAGGAAGGGGSAGTAGQGGAVGDAVIFGAGEDVKGLALDSTYLYISRKDGVIGVERFGSLGSGKTKLYVYGGQPNVTNVVMGVTVDSSQVFFSILQTNVAQTFYVGAIAHNPIQGGITDLIYAGCNQNPFDPKPFARACGVIGDKDNLYWISSRGLVKGPKAGGGSYCEGYTFLSDSLTELCGSGEERVFALAQDDTSVYWAESDKVRKVAKDGLSAPIDLAVGQVGPTSVVEQDGMVYWTNRGAGASDGSLLRIASKGGATETLASGQARPYGLAVDAAHVYWTVQGSCSAKDGQVSRAALGGGPVETVMGSLQCPRGIVADKDQIYWISQSPVQAQYQYIYRKIK